MSEYNSYQPTDLPWVKRVPQHWRLIRNGALLSWKQNKVGESFSQFDLLSLTTTGIRVKDINDVRGKVPASYEGYQEVLPSEMVFCLFDLDCSAVFAGKSNHHGMITSAYDVAVPNESEVNSSFLDYWFISVFAGRHYKIYSKSVRYTINWDIFRAIKLPVPPRAEQDQIARYLDWQVSKINKLIAAKKKQIAMLKEREQQIIAYTVTHGIDKEVDTSDSGVEWIGEIPLHWKVMRCKYLFHERDERSADGNETHLSMSQKYGLVPDTQLDERRMLSASYAGGKLCYEGDLVLNRLKAHLGVFALAPQYGVISPDYTVLIPNAGQILPSFAETVLKSSMCRRELRIRVRGVTEGFWRLYTDDFYTIKLPVPSVDEQKAIMQYLTALHESTTAYEESIKKEIDALHELRTRIISDVVTGQIDVRNIEVPDFEIVEEVEENEDTTDESAESSEVTDE